MLETTLQYILTMEYCAATEKNGENLYELI